MATTNGGNIRKGSFILFKNQPHLVTRTEFVSPGKGSAFTRAKLKNVKNGSVQEFTFKSTEVIEELDVITKEMQFSYIDGEDVFFMDPRSYEQVSVPADLLEGKIGYLTTDVTMYVVFLDEEAIGVRFPPSVKLKVTYAEDATAGNRVNAPKKPVTVETGATIQAPLFVKAGDVLIVDTESGEYISRSN
jgi:elongation factor P